MTKRNKKIEHQLKITQMGQAFGAALFLTGILIISGLSIYLPRINGAPVMEFFLEKIGPIIVILGLIIGIVSSAFKNKLSIQKRNAYKENA